MARVHSVGFLPNVQNNDRTTCVNRTTKKHWKKSSREWKKNAFDYNYYCCHFAVWMLET